MANAAKRTRADHGVTFGTLYGILDRLREGLLETEEAFLNKEFQAQYEEAFVQSMDGGGGVGAQEDLATCLKLFRERGREEGRNDAKPQTPDTLTIHYCAGDGGDGWYDIYLKDLLVGSPGEAPSVERIHLKIATSGN